MIVVPTQRVFGYSFGYHVGNEPSNETLMFVKVKSQHHDISLTRRATSSYRHSYRLTVGYQQAMECIRWQVVRDR